MLVVGGKACLSQVVKSQTPMGSDGMEDERRREATSWSTPVPVWQLRRPAATTNLAKYLVLLPVDISGRATTGESGLEATKS